MPDNDHIYRPVRRSIHELIAYQSNETRFHQAWLSNRAPYGQLSDPSQPHSEDNPWLPQIVRGQSDSTVRAGHGNVVRAGRADNPTVFGSYIAQHAAALAGYAVAADYDPEVNSRFEDAGPFNSDWMRERIRVLWELATTGRVYSRDSDADEATLRLSDAARLLGVAHRTLSVQARRGVLGAVKRGRDWYVSPNEVERYRREHLGNVGRPRTEGS